MEAHSYVCPNCGAPMEFDGMSQQMCCTHCGTFETVEAMEERHRELSAQYAYDNSQDLIEEDSVSGDFEMSGEVGDIKVYRCQGCGAEILTDENTAATFCSFCGRPSLMEDRLQGVLLPSGVIPFKIQKRQAEELYKAWAKKGILTPSILRSHSTIEKIRGIYVPFWLYDYHAEVDMGAKCTKVRRETRGDYVYTHTDHFMVERNLATDFLKLPADASKEMPDDVMDKLEPFMYQDLTRFEMPYLSGYYAEKYNFDSQQMAPRIEKRVREYINNAARETIVGYSSVNVIRSNVKMRRKAADYVLLPVWMLTYTFQGKTHMFAMNGQTGRIVADRPISKKKSIAWFSGIFAALTGILYLVGMFL